MANIKFSDFTENAAIVQADHFLVGYDDDERNGGANPKNNRWTFAQVAAGISPHIDNIYTADGSVATGTNRTLTLAGTGTLKIAGAGAVGDFMIKNAGNDADAYTVYMTDGTGQANVGAYGGINFISRYGSVGSTASYNNQGVWSFERNVVIKGQSYNNGITVASGSGTTTITPNWDSGNVQECTLTASTAHTLANSTNLEIGATYILIVKQAAGGSGTISSYGTQYEFPSATAPTLTATGNKADVFTLVAANANTLICTSVLNFTIN